MIGHDDEFVEKELSLVSIMQKHVDEESGGGILLEERSPLGCDRGNEKSSIHESNVARNRGNRCAFGHDPFGWFRAWDTRACVQAVLVEESALRPTSRGA